MLASSREVKWNIRQGERMQQSSGLCSKPASWEVWALPLLRRGMAGCPALHTGARQDHYRKHQGLRSEASAGSRESSACPPGEPQACRTQWGCCCRKVLGPDTHSGGGDSYKDQMRTMLGNSSFTSQKPNSQIQL